MLRFAVPHNWRKRGKEPDSHNHIGADAYLTWPASNLCQILISQPACEYFFVVGTELADRWQRIRAVCVEVDSAGDPRIYGIPQSS